MSWVYWLPKSRTRIIRVPLPRRPQRVWGLFESVVRSFLGDDDVVRVALAHAGGADLQEARLGAELVERAAAAVAHAGLQAADELMDVEREAALVGNAALDAFRDELHVGLVALEV